MAVHVLEAPRIIDTVQALHQRITSRFPTSGLARLCGELYEVAKQSAARSARIESPILSIRIFSWLLALTLITLVIGSFAFFGLSLKRDLELTDFIQTFEAGLSEAVLLGAGLFFLISFERRIKRRRALKAIHELRSIAHIIDMHQLTKDPERLLKRYTSTSVSPREAMTKAELNRYLDYCTEMLSLTSKVAALYVQHFDDEVALEAVSDVEDLATGLSQKIWQKIMILQQMTEDEQIRQQDTVKPADQPADEPNAQGIAAGEQVAAAGK
jgi:hypothetical protein